MKSNLKITIGIPAFNEASNIATLLRSILSQRLRNKKIKFIVISDASTDATTQEAKKIGDKRITVIEQKKRLGKNATLNNLIKYVRGDIFVQLDGDVLPLKSTFLENLTAPILDGSAEMVAAEVEPSKPQTFIEYLTHWGQLFKTVLYRSINNGNTIYLCYGRARAFSKKIYKSIYWPGNCPEDSYSYLYCQKLNGKFMYQQKSKVLFRCPANFSDYVKQSNRFILGKQLLKKYFPAETVDNAFQIPFYKFFYSYFTLLFTNPIDTLTKGTGYALLTLYRQFFSTNESGDPAEYEYLSTTKEPFKK